ncbi:MAG: DUF4384 domain-containing protein [Candidatus Cloacimonetes bacterium]|jgi:hypothetical protein|nr:DUF4384 domain-containing protein [Candidatus Cloacimonadota bacterium]MCB5286979.1 DUF4384 domain-containing protein [Candidatus Cloacimonadota bacterium]MCK9184580.1 DUF4384 domain-containing protein [Candidatus Cloacimonadota bacterium]MCK9583644.1 DUF4384 domain-containing protein [Candidatus Cloacimonadota bacterium]MDY0229299.1 DUF4384 domain-containing protein [Candidatus Cloacimonadaceae bacterium]
MVSRPWGWLATFLAVLLLGACAKNQPEVKPAQDVSFAQTREAAQRLTDEMEGKTEPVRISPAPVSAFMPGQIASVSQLKPGQPITVEIDTFRVYNDDISLKEARVQTLQFVRQLALEQALPTDINLTSLTATMLVERDSRYDESVATGIFMMSSSAGRFVHEELLRTEPEFDGKSSSLRYRMRYRAQIMPLEKIYNPSLRLDVQLSETLLKDGDEFTLRVTPNASGYLYLFDFLSDGSATLVFPNRDMQENGLQAGQAWQQNLRAVSDPDRDYCIETLYFVYSLEPISGWEDFRSNRSADELVFSAGEESFILFQNWLSRSDPLKRVEKMAQLHIFNN